MEKFMDAIVKAEAGPGLELRRVPVPVPGPGEVLIKVRKTAICGTDVHIYNWDPWAVEHIKPPMTIGHEYVGEIAQLGDGVTGLHVGQRVSGEGHITCHHCRNCHNGNIQWCKDTKSVGVDRDGAFAEFVCIPQENVIIIDESLPEDVVAFFDAFGNATHTALMFPLIGEDVLITGAGPIGIIAAARGAKRVIGVELNKTAVRDAKSNARRNRIENIEFYAGDASRFITEMAAAGEKVDVIMMDPPRAGSTEEFLTAVCKMAPPKVVYVSCNPATLARDVKILTAGGFTVQAVQPVDMFPRCGHVESVCLLTRP